MILIINLNKYKLHDLEFIKPITDLLKDYKIIHYKSLKSSHLKQAKKIIIAGTSLKNNDYLKDLKNFEWIKNYDKPVLGICSGMQIVALVHGAKLKKSKEIGQTQIKILKKDSSINTIDKVYSLHQFSVTLPKDFTLIAKSLKCIQIIRKDNLLGLLFHPEVYNKEIISKFSS